MAATTLAPPFAFLALALGTVTAVRVGVRKRRTARTRPGVSPAGGPLVAAA